MKSPSKGTQILYFGAKGAGVGYGGGVNLSTPIEKIPRIGLAYQKKLKKLGIKTVRDLLFHFPHRYEDFSNIIPISEIKLNESCSIQGRVLEIKNTRTWKKKMFLTQALVADDTGTIKVVWFNQPYLTNVLKKENRVSLSGKAVSGPDGIYLSNPAYEKMPDISANFKRANLTHTGRLVPVYPETEGLSSRWLRYIIKPLLVKLKNKIPDPLPEKIVKESKFLPIERALWQIHFPDSQILARKAQARFQFEELFNISLFVLRERMRLAREKAIPLPLNLKIIQKFVSQLPFKLTAAQKKSSWQILRDLERARPMNRLLEGDVGSGKTVVATMAALNVVKGGCQVAFMAPTEILAKQHFQEISKLLKNFKLRIALLTGKENKIWSRAKISRKKLLQKLGKGEIDILIGTHALIQEKIQFKKLALVIVDEQHRFGVEQRAKLVQSSKAKSQSYLPHLLSMTATPIPRTLALTIYGDLDLSLLDELPKGRKKIITKVIPPAARKEAYDFIRKQVKKGRQVFVICPRIEPSPKAELNSEKTPQKKDVLSWADVRAVKEEYQKLSKKVFPDLKVGMLHGRMKSQEKEKIMESFKKKEISILVSTSVVEVGVDIPNATVMMIEGAERFGLAQLHQFRGRVGRSKYQSYCFLFTDSPAKRTSQRLKALVASQNGFALSEKDLEIRGPGAINGVRQWGIPDIAMASLKDVFLVEKTRRLAKELLEKDPELKKYPLLQERLKEFRERIHLE